MQKIKCRIAPSLGDGFAGHPNDVLGTETYNPDTDLDEPCVFFGMYWLPDFYALWRHRGKKWILWAGSDIRHLSGGYWLEDGGDIRLDTIGIPLWINKHCESWCENGVEQQALKVLGIEAKANPSFLGDVSKYPISFKRGKIRVYTSVSGDDFKVYGWDKIDKLAREHPSIEFHLYGNRGEWKTKRKNVIVHGRVSQETMDRETSQMSGALRLTEFDGFSEIIAKSILWGQYPVSLIEYPGVLHPDYISYIGTFKGPNLKAREYLLSVVNNYPWVK